MHFFFKDPRWQTSTVTTMERLKLVHVDFKTIWRAGARLQVVAPSSNMQWVVAMGQDGFLQLPDDLHQAVAPEASCVKPYQ
jgi:hypothetical protein